MEESVFSVQDPDDSNMISQLEEMQEHSRNLEQLSYHAENAVKKLADRRQTNPVRVKDAVGGNNWYSVGITAQIGHNVS